jgi:hypothetical protein
MDDFLAATVFFAVCCIAIITVLLVLAIGSKSRR